MSSTLNYCSRIQYLEPLTLALYIVPLQRVQYLEESNAVCTCMSGPPMHRRQLNLANNVRIKFDRKQETEGDPDDPDKPLNEAEMHILPGAFDGLEQLDYLDLSDNGLKKIDPGGAIP